MDLNKKNVFILGAGASVDYNFPAGQRLLEIIFTLLKSNYYYNNKFVRFSLFKLLEYRRKTPKTFEETNAFIDEFCNKLANSGTKSIDDFLKEYPKFSLLGKLCITLSISMFESEYFTNIFQETKIKKEYFQEEPIYNSICKSPKRGKSPVLKQAKIYKIEDGWYQMIWRRIYEEMATASNYVDAFIDICSKLKIITFNYDRSFEWYLYNRLCNMFDLSEKDKENIGKQLNKNIIHVYGKLGDIWEEPNNPYNPVCIYSIYTRDHYIDVQDRLDNNNDLINGRLILDENYFNEGQIKHILELANSIKTYNDIRAADQGSEIETWINNPDNLFFLGFGYIKQNLELLSKNILIPKNSYPNIYGTAYRIGKSRSQEIIRLLKGYGFTKSNKTKLKIDFEDNLKITEYLEEKILL